MFDSQFDRLLLRIPEHDLTERRASGVIHVQDRFFTPGHGLNGSPDQILASRRQDLDKCGSYQ